MSETDYLRNSLDAVSRICPRDGHGGPADLADDMLSKARRALEAAVCLRDTEEVLRDCGYSRANDFIAATHASELIEGEYKVTYRPEDGFGFDAPRWDVTIKPREGERTALSSRLARHALLGWDGEDDRFTDGYNAAGNVTVLGNGW
jgi:hypothetical protein